jgi:virulence-associated protein VapD
MYAVTFDIDTNCLNAYGNIRKFMEANNFILVLVLLSLVF